MQAVHLDEIAAFLEVYTSQIIKDLSGLHIASMARKCVKLIPEGTEKVATSSPLGSMSTL